ncbi:helix-turn-helix transcriptional regulator [Planomonospora sp. ID82291]|uniref:helix-turn-helix domain-containing protein n=1 Tax=Planomonospora sp. ID82291 TaxID=2738136 RepID=UPI0018C429C0|nr:helix-turn-helix transcriptional regulator [Planomonospora sp. ID82291]MBG0818369.1 helix-turn-helix domain-containing protein [Planomonospora sp. ID82291]
MSSPSPAVSQAKQALGARLRAIREAAGLTGRDLAARAGWHSSKVSRIEHGRQLPSEADITAWCFHCGASEQAADLVASLRTIDEMYVEWRRLQRTGLQRLQKAAIPLYERTSYLRIYEPSLVPGLFQTREYALALMQAVVAFRGIPDDSAQAVEARLHRQAIFHAGGRRCAVIVEEAALRARIGGVETMAGQLGHLLAAASRSNVSLGVIPALGDRVMWPTNGFWIFDEERVLVETLSAELTITPPQEIALYAKAFAELAQLAVYGAAARTLITAAIAALDT